MSNVINGIQQIGIGVVDAKSVFNWYRKYLGFDVLVFQDEATASLMTRYTSNKPQDRYAMLALNMIGGGGLEIWQFTSRSPEPSKTPILLGDLGINAMKIRTSEIEKCHEKLRSQNLSLLTEVTENKKSHFFFVDPWNNLVQVVSNEYCFCKTKACSGGVLGTIIGVSDMDRSLDFYSQLLGFDTIVSDRTGIFEDFADLPGGHCSFRRTLIERSNKKIGGFGELLGPCQIELVEVKERQAVKIYKDRLWGDLGYIHLCFDVYGMDSLRDDAQRLNYGFTVDSANSFDMGEAAGHFSYVEDPDGTLIEFVETHKVPILKKLGLFINLKKRNPLKPLPRWLVKAMKVHRVKKDLN